MKNMLRIAPAFLSLFSTANLAEAAANQDLQSTWIEVTSGVLFGSPGGKPQLLLTLRNKTDATEWVKVRFAPPAPNLECVLVNEIKGGEKAGFACTQEKIVPDTDYPVFVTTYRNQEATDEVETKQTTMRFSRGDTAALEEFLGTAATPGLPATFDDVNSAEKMSLGTALFGGLGRGDGVLVVQESGLRYTFKKKITEIPVSQMQKVTIRDLGGDDTKRWVVVEYSERDTIRTIGFQGSPFRGAGPRIAEMEKVISYVLSKYRSTHEK